MRKIGQTKSKYLISVEESLGKKSAIRQRCQNMIYITLMDMGSENEKCK
jgi:hypothetical protein